MGQRNWRRSTQVAEAPPRWDRQQIEVLEALARAQFPTPIVIGPVAIALEAERQGLKEKW